MRSGLRPLAALAMVALIGAGCSKAPTASGGGNGGDQPATNRAKAVQFAECMRRNGVTAFPDPDASGELTIDGIANGSSLDPSSPTFTRADTACKDLEPAGFTGHKRSAKEQQSALQFAQCMRDNGVPDFADPNPDGPLLNIDGSKPGLKAAVDAAGKKCRDFAAGAGVRSP
jgi:hypothetical protein